MDLLTQIAETRIREAVERGDFDDLPGAGRPLVLDDDRDVPQELRVAYRILRNAGCVPPEVELLRQIATVETLVRLTDAGDPEYRPALRKLALLRLRLGAARSRFDAIYQSRLLGRLR